MSAEAHPIAKFRVGIIYQTANARAEVPFDDIVLGIRRHQACDWGDVDADDRQRNDCALKKGTRLVSVYRSSAGVKFYIITEADRSLTTVLLPSDY